MSTHKPGIPSVPPGDHNLHPVLQAIIENIEIINGVRTGNFDVLSAHASTAQIIAKINELLNRLNTRV